MTSRFADDGLSTDEVLDELKARIDQPDQLARYQDDPILGFPGTAPLDVGIQAFAMVSRLNPNNNNSHTRGSETSRRRGAFSATYDLERDVIGMLAALVGANISPDAANAVDGYLASGGTEANIMGMWIGRNKLLAQSDIRKRGLRSSKVRVIASLSAHYSVRKACDLLGLGQGEWSSCAKDSGCVTRAALEAEGAEGGDAPLAMHHFIPPDPGDGGLVLVGLDENCRMDMKELEHRIDEAIATGITKFIIVATAGTTLTGAFDPVDEIGELVQRKRREPSSPDFYVHVDAAFGGLVAPFLTSQRPAFDFGLCADDGRERMPIVDSMTIDPHKMGMAPYPAGAFLCRKRYQEHIDRVVGYISSHKDDTLIGSRPGAAAAACWAVFRHLGRSGFETIVAGCIENTQHLSGSLQSMGGVTVYPKIPPINVLAAQFDPDVYDRRSVKDLASKYHVVSDLLAKRLDECPQRVYRFVIMPHVTKSTLDSFLDDLRKMRM